MPILYASSLEKLYHAGAVPYLSHSETTKRPTGYAMIERIRRSIATFLLRYSIRNTEGLSIMLQDDIHSIYLKLKLYYYRRIFRKMDTAADDSLTALETFCAEAIYGLGSPTLSEFAEFINVSQPNAAYKIANLEKKGFVRKLRSEEDGRVVFLQVTEKFLAFYGTSQRYASILVKPIQRRFTEEEVEIFHRVMHTLSEELMKEVNQYLVRRANLPKGVLDEHANPLSGAADTVKHPSAGEEEKTGP